MSLSFDDKILGEKTDYYCSSSEDERYDSCEEELGSSKISQNTQESDQVHAAQPSLTEYSGHSSNTGPKGVIEDWRRYKQLENEKRDEADKERQALAKKLSVTCRTTLEDEREKSKDQAYMNEIEEMLDEFDDEFLKEYRAKRIESMRNYATKVPVFGNVMELNRSGFLEAIDKENPITTVVIHIYKKGLISCNSMNKCLENLSVEYTTVKFCKIEVTEVQLSLNFCISGVPALLIYKNGELIGNFVKLSDEFGDEFYANDVESFLIEHGLLPDNSCTKPSGIRGNVDTSRSEIDDSD